LDFPSKKYGSKSRKFSASWYKKYDWIEYSKSKHAAYCFYCFLFKQPGSSTHFGHDVFNKIGYSNWKHASEAFPLHVGGVNSAHNQARLHCDDFGIRVKVCPINLLGHQNTPKFYTKFV
jgi:hypothetical protein